MDQAHEPHHEKEHDTENDSKLYSFRAVGKICAVQGRHLKKCEKKRNVWQ